MKVKELPVIELFIPPHNLMDLKSNIWNDEPVDGKLKVGNNRHHIQANYRGSHIRKLKKKSYFIKHISPKELNGAKETRKLYGAHNIT